MQEIFCDDLKRLDERFERVLKRFPEARREAAYAVGKELLDSVQKRIGGHGKVMGWQTYAVGTGGGYAAVRAKAKTYVDKKGNYTDEHPPESYAVGYLTNAIDNGHKVRGPSGKSKRYQPRLKMSRVHGKGVYRAAAEEVESVALRAAEKLVSELEAAFGG